MAAQVPALPEIARAMYVYYLYVCIKVPNRKKSSRVFLEAEFEARVAAMAAQVSDPPKRVFDTLECVLDTLE